MIFSSFKQQPPFPPPPPPPPPKKKERKENVNDTAFGFYVFSGQDTLALEVSPHLVAATAEIKR